MIERLKSLLQQTSNFDPNITIDETTVILRDLKLDSFELVSLICKVEDEFDIEIPDKQIKKFVTIGDLIEFIETQ